MRDNTNFQVMNAHIQTAMSSRLSSSFRLVDFFGLGGAMPEEVVNGHGSQMLNLWVWTVMFNAMCPAELAAEGSYAFWEGQLCSGTEVQKEFLFKRKQMKQRWCSFWVKPNLKQFRVSKMWVQKRRTNILGG